MNCFGRQLQLRKDLVQLRPVALPRWGSSLFKASCKWLYHVPYSVWECETICNVCLSIFFWFGHWWPKGGWGNFSHIFYSIDWVLCLLTSADQAPIDCSLDIFSMFWAQSKQIKECLNLWSHSCLHVKQQTHPCRIGPSPSISLFRAATKWPDFDSGILYTSNTESCSLSYSYTMLYIPFLTWSLPILSRIPLSWDSVDLKDKHVFAQEVNNIPVAFWLLIFTMSANFNRDCNSMCIRLDGKTGPNHQDWLSVGRHSWWSGWVHLLKSIDMLCVSDSSPFVSNSVTWMFNEWSNSLIGQCSLASVEGLQNWLHDIVICSKRQTVV